MLACAASMALLAAYHLVFLPTGSISQRPENAKQVVDDFIKTAVTFFDKRAFWGMLAFVFLYRLGEGLVLMEGQLFLQSDVAKGGLGLHADQVSNIDAVFGTVASLLGGLLGGWFVAKLTLPRALGILGLCLNVPHFTYLFLSQAAVGHHGLPYETVVAAVSIEKFGYGFGFVGNMVYMMQQLAPGRSTMTHYAFATSLMNLMLIPTNMISGPLAEALGFSTFFFVVMFASVPSAWAAFRAPFPLGAGALKLAEGSTADEQNVITPDDPSELTVEQRGAQKLAGWASLLAMCNVLVILIFDSTLLGALREAQGALRLVYLGLLVACAAGTAALTFVTLRAVAASVQESTRVRDAVYIANARGARVVTWLCVAATGLVLGLGFKLGL